MTSFKLNIDNTFNRELPADPITENSRRQVKNACFSYVTPRKTANPELIHISDEMLKEIGLTNQQAKSETFLKVFTGNEVLKSTKPYAMCYGGHQFGHWAGQLGDGRAINLTEVVHNKKRWALQLKGAGETPYSRSADGLAVLRSSIREYLCSEAMYHLGIPTTRALSIALTGDEVLRDMLYDGNPAYEKGAVVCRAAASFIRFGNFEILAAQEDFETLQKLTDYTIRHFYPHLGKPSKKTYVQFFKEVADRVLKTIVHWQRVGFVHGVLNTDNMSILGLTIDYGPYGWLEGFDYGWTPNTTDTPQKRYHYGNQPNIGLWNLYQLANALYPLINDAKPMEGVLKAYREKYEEKSLKMMQNKLGFTKNEKEDALLITDLDGLLEQVETDMTLFYRKLSTFNKNKPEEGVHNIKDAFYVIDDVNDEMVTKWNDWFKRYSERLKLETATDEERSKKMNTTNPKYVLRNYMAQLAIDAAGQGDYSLIKELYELLKNPYAEQLQYEKWFAKRPEWARHKVGCSVLSCSS